MAIRAHCPLVHSGLAALGAAFALAVGTGIRAEEPAAPPSPVRAELQQLLLADAKQAAPNAGAKAAAPLAAKAADVAPPPLVRSAPSGVVGEPLGPELWNYFTDTGILTSSQGRKITKELTFGPCTDGELLNQRYFW